MKLSVRGLGSASGGDKTIYVDRYTVLVDCSYLRDEPRMELTKIQRLGDGFLTPGLRVIAGVTINELTDFLVDRKVELYQYPDNMTGEGTVVGSIVTGSPGVVAPVGGALGGCLADEVIAIRIVDSRGELLEFSDALKVKTFVANMGLLGLVSDVVLRYRELSRSQVCFFIIIHHSPNELYCFATIFATH